MSVADRISALTPEQRALFELLRGKRRKPRSHQPPPIPRLSGPDGAGDWPLSFDQERLWFLYQMEPESTAYNIDLGTLMTGELDLPALHGSLNEIVRRHAAWRTTFPTVDGRPVQRVAPRLELALPMVDLSALPPARRRQTARAIQTAEGRRPFALETGPLVRLCLLRLGEREHVCLLTVHHNVTDWVTFQLFWRELAALYTAGRAGRPSPLPEPPVHYSDFALWQRDWMSGEVLRDYLDFWLGQLEGFPLQLELPVDRPWPAKQTLRGGRRTIALGRELTAGLRALARRFGATPFMAVMAAVYALLHRFSGQQRMILGSPSANRNRPEIEPLLGFFLTQLAYATDLAGDPPFRELLARVRKTALEAYAHQDVPFGKLIEALVPERIAGRPPLLQAVVLLLDSQYTTDRLPDLEFQPMDVYDGNSRYDLMWGLYESPEAIAGWMEFNAEVFDPATAERLVERLLAVLEVAVADPDVPLSRLPALSPAARHQALVEWNDTAPLLAAVAAATPVSRLFAIRAAAAPNAPALLFAGAAVSYGELDRRADRLARRLRALGVDSRRGTEARVALLLRRTPDLPAALLGVWQAGGAAVPLDPEQPAARLAALLADAEPALLVCAGPLPEGLALPAGLPLLRLDEVADSTVEESAAPPAADPRPESLAYLIYTSGTTGRPKAVAVEHGSLARTLSGLVARFGFAADDRMPHLASFSFDISLFELLAPLLAGGTSELLTREELLETPRLLAAVAAATRVHAVPSLMRQIAAAAAAAGPDAFPRLRTLFTGGDRVPPDLLAELAATFPAARAVVLYGPTEATIVCAAHPVPPGRPPDRALVGRPLDGVELRVVDPSGAPVPLGAAGELWIGGPGVARGYHRRDELTAERFVAALGRRFYRSGDLVRQLADGLLEFLGRTDDQVKVRGLRVEPGEVEAALAAHPGVREAVVAARAEAGSAGGEQRLVAWIVPSRPGRPPAGEDLRGFLAARLPASMVPAAFVALEELPVTAHGKVDRARLPEPEDALAGRPKEPPRTPAEELVAGIWCELLGRPEVGRGDDFFALGGHSLLATRAAMRASEAAGTRVPVKALFEAPTLAAFAARVEAARAGAPSAAAARPLVPLPRGAGMPLSFAQERLWFLDRLAPGNPAFNLPLPLALDGPLAPGALAGAFAGVVRRHEALRTAFGERDGRPVQAVLAAPAVWELPLADLSALPEAAGEAEARRLATAESLLPFDLARGPLLRSTLLRLGGERNVLLLDLHHIAADAWSMGVLVREAAALYGALAGGGAAPLPELPVQYADYAAWQRAWLAGAELERQLAYWRGRLAGAPAVLHLPTDRPRPPLQGFRGGSLRFAFPEDLSRAVRALARREGATLFMVLFAAFSALLARLSGQRDLVVGTSIASRDRPELELLIGLFVNTLAMRVELADDPDFGALLAAVRASALDAYAHRDLPFEKLVEELKPARDRSRPPLVQALCTLENTPVEPVELAGLALAPLAVGGTTAKLDLTLVAFEDGPRLAGNLEYAADLFDAATIERLAGYLRHLLAGAVASTGLRFSELPLLGEAEREQLLVEWNRTASAYPRESTLPELFAEQAALRPGAVAVSWEGGEWTYGELAARAGRLSRRLAEIGVGPEVPVALLAERSPAAVAALLGIAGAGGFYVPLDPGFPAERLALLLADSGAAVLVGERRLLDELPAGVASRVAIEIDLDEALDEALAGSGGAAYAPPPGLFAESLAYAMYTSGSTGRPKGVWVTHRNVVRLVRGADYADFGPEEAFLQYAPLSFDASTLEVWGPLLNGGRLALAPPGRLSPAELGRAVERGGTTAVWLTAGLFHEVVAAGLPGFGGVRQLLAGGDALAAADLRQALELLPGCRVIDGYGPTEGTTFTCCHAMSRPEEVGGAVPIGRPIANSRVYVLDGDLAPVPAGVWGELYAGGDGLARGYLGRPERTAERFVPDPFGREGGGEPGGRLYRTGDLVRWRREGVLEFLGRRDGQVKVRGFRVELGEVEAALAAHPGVREAVAMLREDRPGDRRLVGYVVARDGSAAKSLPEELAAQLRERLPEPLVPSAIVVLAALPLSANGKLDRAALPAPELAGDEEAHQAPATELERRLVETSAEVLGLDPARIGMRDSFFGLGGHSLLATQLVVKLQDRHGIELPLQDVFDARDLADLADRIVERELAGADERLLAEALAELAPGLAAVGEPEGRA